MQCGSHDQTNLIGPADIPAEPKLFSTVSPDHSSPCKQVLVVEPYSDKLSMDETGSERSEIQRFCCKNVLLRRYGNLVVFHHLVIADKYRK